MQCSYFSIFHLLRWCLEEKPRNSQGTTVMCKLCAFFHHEKKEEKTANSYKLMVPAGDIEQQASNLSPSSEKAQ